MIIFARHAERGDNQFPNQHSQIIYDPPITKTSSQTISTTAEEMLQLFKLHHINKLKVQSSKFLRCLMTAQGLIKHLKEGGIQIIEPKIVSNQVTQYMRQDWFKQYPLNKLIFDSEYLNNYLLLKNWTEIQLETNHPFPQNYVMFHQRIAKFKQKLIFPQQTDICHLIVTHGFVVRELCWRMNQIPNYSAQIKYCGFAAFKHNGLQQILLKSRL